MRKKKTTTKVNTSFRLVKFELDRARKNADRLGMKFTEFVELVIHDGNEKYGTITRSPRTASVQ